MIAIARASALLSIAALATGMLVGNASDAAPSLTAGSNAKASVAGEQDATQLGDGKIRGEGYVVSSSAESLSVGKKGFITVEIKAGEGYKVNDQYPHKIKFKSIPDGLSVPKMVKKKDGAFEGKKVFRFKVAVTAAKAGDFKVSGKLKFSVCNDKSCIIQKKMIKVALSAK